MSRLSFVEEIEPGEVGEDSDGYVSSDRSKHMALNSYDIMGVGSGCASMAGASMAGASMVGASMAGASMAGASMAGVAPNTIVAKALAPVGWEEDYSDGGNHNTAVATDFSATRDVQISDEMNSSVLDAARPPFSSTNTPNRSPAESRVQAPMSKWLHGFLMHKKEAGSTLLKPDIIPMSDTFISEFSDSTRHHLAVRGLNKISESDSDSDVSEFDATGLSSNLIAEVEKDSGDFDKIILKLFNLPYHMTAEQIEDTAAVEGVQLRNVEIHIDKSTKLPRGSASAELVKHHGVDDGEVLDVEGAVAVLTGADFGGRPLRVERSTNKTQSRKSSAGGPRYFGGSNGINTKCFLCGEVGHIQSECTSDPVVRCHLCARADHDPADCPNIICYRCGEFGHHSKTCTSYYSNEKATLCTACGGTTHDNRGCKKRFGTPNLEKLEGPGVVCMICKKFGHALCRRTLRPPDRAIYCPNCGEKGHHIDHPDLGRVACRTGWGGGISRYSDFGGRDMGINYNSGRGRDTDRRYSEGAAESRKRQRYSEDSDSDALEAYMKDLSKSHSKSTGRKVVLEQYGGGTHSDEEELSKSAQGNSKKRNRRTSY